MGGSWLYRLYFPTDSSKPKSVDPKPSQEVLLLMMMFSTSVPLVVAGYLVRHFLFLSIMNGAESRSAYLSDSTTPELSYQISYPHQP
jgi:hypothetical protein